MKDLGKVITPIRLIRGINGAVLLAVIANSYINADTTSKTENVLEMLLASAETLGLLGHTQSDVLHLMRSGSLLEKLFYPECSTFSRGANAGLFVLHLGVNTFAKAVIEYSNIQAMRMER